MLRASILKSRSGVCPDSTHALTRAPKAGAAAPDTELTPQALAEMSEEGLPRCLTNYKRAATRRSSCSCLVPDLIGLSAVSCYNSVK